VTTRFVRPPNIVASKPDSTSAPNSGLRALLPSAESVTEGASTPPVRVAGNGV
jgi:hypothetical protein